MVPTGLQVLPRLMLDKLVHFTMRRPYSCTLVALVGLLSQSRTESVLKSKYLVVMLRQFAECAKDAFDLSPRRDWSRGPDMKGEHLSLVRPVYAPQMSI